MIQRHIKVGETFDIEAIERALANAWLATAAESEGEEALLRARAANLIIFLPNKAALEETRQTVAELTSMHPCRVLVLVGDRDADNKDIEVYISAPCPKDKRYESRLLCCEEITLSAAGDFVSELPSAAIPLLIPDLPVFLWWCDVLRVDEKLLETLLARVDRLIIDSADFQDSPGDLAALARVLAADVKQTTTVSDINWERLTPWRASLANFYDVPSYRKELNRINRLRIEYVVQGSSSESPAAQPLLIAGWLASRLGWKFVRQTTAPPPDVKTVLQFAKDDRSIEVELNPSQAPGLKLGRILRVELESSGDEHAVFQVHRSADAEYLETSVNVGLQHCPGTRVRFRNLTTTQLLSREMEILGGDKIYEEAIGLAGRTTQPRNR
ncbi:MAG TPA: glucose-6-phosphate dehydrogenase assembly protein OpcA [Pyrinomonadaceae bacterium]|nr:glucose-6-phosphate dehydrogenase assembly protein OpcA [Pyrinomonadaceae bacterium]